MAKRAKPKAEKLHPIGEKILWVEKSENISKMIKGLAIFCGLLFIINLFVHLHGHFDIEAIPGFYGVYGFIAFSFIVITTKYLREVIGRKEDYYAPGVIDPEKYPDEELDVREHDDV